MQQYKIAIIGPESTGKTTLCKQLAEYYKGVMVEEASRDYLNSLNRKYNENDLVEIAKLQVAKEDEVKSQKIIFYDTNLMVIRIWSMDKFNNCNQEILKLEKERKYDLILLTFPDLKWEEDPLREDPFRRDEIFKLYENALAEVNYQIIKGEGDQRFNNAVEIINKTFPGLGNVGNA